MHLHDIERMLAQCGWYLSRITDTHRQYHNARGQRVTVAAHGKRTFSAREVQMIRRDMERAGASASTNASTGARAARVEHGRKARRGAA